MALTSLKAQIIINQFNNLKNNQQVHISASDAPDVNYFIISFKGNINPGYPKGIKLHLKSTKEIDKEYISVSNNKDIIDYFIIIDNKYVWERLSFMVQTGADENNIFRVVYQIQLEDIHHQSHGYFGLIRIGNVVSTLPNPLVVSDF